MDKDLNDKVREIAGAFTSISKAEDGLAEIDTVLTEAGFEVIAPGVYERTVGKKRQFARSFYNPQHQRKDSKDGQYKRGLYHRVNAWVTMSEGANQDYADAFGKASKSKKKGG